MVGKSVTNLASVLFLVMIVSAIGAQPSQAQEAGIIENQIIFAINSERRQAEALDLVENISPDDVAVTESSNGVMVLELMDEADGVVQRSPEEICRKLRLQERDQRRQGDSPYRFSRHCEQNQEFNAEFVPDDPYYSSMWAMQRLNMSTVWDYARGSSDLVVAVIDTGVSYLHEDLSSNMWKNPGEIPANGIDDDRNGYVDDIYGIDTFNNDSDPMDDQGHGTHVAGTIGASTNNSTGVSGLNWNIKIMALKFLGANGSGSTAGAIAAVNYVRKMKERGINIVLSNNSWGGGGYSQLLYDAIVGNRDADVLFVAAAGNNSTNTDASPHFPSSYNVDNVISVASITSSGSMSSFSNYGYQNVDLGAPGSKIDSCGLNNTYANMSGTSMATPHVSGALALLKSYSSGLNYLGLKNKILQTVKPNAALSGKTVTGGELDLLAAIQASSFAPVLPPTPTLTPVPTSTPTPPPTPTATPVPATPTPTATPRSGNWSLRVVDQDQVSLSQVSVTIIAPSGSSQVVTTGADGSIVISALSGGNYRATFSKQGYVFPGGELTVRIDGNVASVVSAVRATYPIQGAVLSRYTAGGVGGAQVEVFVDGRLSATLAADLSGGFSVQVPYGSLYRFEVRHPDFYSESVSGVVLGRAFRTVAMVPN